MHGVGQRIKIHMNFIDENILALARPDIMTNLYFSLFSFALTLRYKFILLEPKASDPIYFFLRRTRGEFQVWVELDVFPLVLP